MVVNRFVANQLSGARGRRPAQSVIDRLAKPGIRDGRNANNVSANSICGMQQVEQIGSRFHIITSSAQCQVQLSVPANWSKTDQLHPLDRFGDIHHKPCSRCVMAGQLTGADRCMGRRDAIIRACQLQACRSKAGSDAGACHAARALDRGC